MVTQAIIDFFVNLFTTLLGLMPPLERPDWADTAITYWTQTLELGTNLAWWVPLQQIYLVASFIFVSLGVSISIKVIRIVASFLTAGGGSAA